MEYLDWASVFTKGNNLANAGKHTEALDSYELAASMRPEHALTWNNIGVAKLCLGEFEQAIPHFSKAIDLDPKYKDAFHNRGLAYSDIGELEKAFNDLTEMIG